MHFLNLFPNFPTKKLQKLHKKVVKYAFISQNKVFKIPSPCPGKNFDPKVSIQFDAYLFILKRSSFHQQKKVIFLRTPPTPVYFCEVNRNRNKDMLYTAVVNLAQDNARVGQFISRRLSYFHLSSFIMILGFNFTKATRYPVTDMCKLVSLETNDSSYFSIQLAVTKQLLVILSISMTLLYTVLQYTQIGGVAHFLNNNEET